MTTTSSESPLSGSPSALFTPFQALVGVITRPRATFARMRDAERGHWWVVLALALIGLVLTTVVTVPIQAEVQQAVMEAQMAEMEGFDEAQLAQIEQTQRIFSSTAVLGAIGTATGLVGLLIGYGVRAGILYALSMVLGGQVTFKQIWRMAVWTALPKAVGSFVSAIAIIVTGQLPAPGLTYILTSAELAEASSILTAVLGRIDIYTLWSLVLIGVGLLATARLSKAKSAIIAAAYWILGAGWAVAMAAAGQALGQTFGGG